MLKTKRFLGIIIISIFLLFNIYTNCYAAVPVTEENLKQAFEEMEDFFEGEAKFSMNNNTITVTADNENYSLNYDLTGNPIFSVVAPIRQGMSYGEFTEQTEKSFASIFGYIAVAYTQGVGFEDSAFYIIMSMLESGFSNVSSSDDSYIIIDDINSKYTGEKSDDPKYIYASEFDDRVMEYVNNTYKDIQTVTDSNTYTWSVEKKDVTDTSCNLVTTLSVNLDGNFEELKGTYADLESSFENSFEANKNTQEEQKKEEELSSGNINMNGTTINIGGLVTDKVENTLTPEEKARQIEKAVLKEMEKEYKEEKNKIPKAGDTTILVLKSITVVSVIALIVVIVCSRKRKV